jgi:hypothetical protein
METQDVNRYDPLKMFAALVVLLNSEAIALGEDVYRDLSNTLAARYPLVKNQSRAYLSKEFARDTSISRPHEANFATSNEPDTVMGLPVHQDIILLQLKPEASVQAIDALLRKYDLSVDSGVAEIGLLIVERGPGRPAEGGGRAAAAAAAEAPTARTHLGRTREGLESLKRTIADLQREPIVRAAAVNIPVGRAMVPKPSSGEAPLGSTVYRWDWSEGPLSAHATRTDGNWGQKDVSFPAAWNFNDAIARARPGSAVKVAILDVGFASHDDLVFDVSPVAPMRPHDHGNHVTGIVAARFDDQVGVDGGCRFARVMVCTAADINGGLNGVQGIQLVLSDVIATLVQLIRQGPDIKVVNLSLGYNWVSNYARNPNNDPEIQNLVKSHGIIMRSIADMAADRMTLLVCAAGNDSNALFPNINAQWSSPFNWAARNNGISSAPAQNILIIESTGRGPARARSGFSNVGGDLAAPGENILSTIAMQRDAYGVMSGTSMAAPQVTALIAQMYAYNPAMAPGQVIAILKRTADTDPNGRRAPIINAFAAMLECYDDDRPLHELADLDGSGRVDMGDFALFRAALIQCEQDGTRNVWPRADLNGNKRLSRDPADKVRIKGQELSDLGVMMRAWQDPQVHAEELPGKL